MKHALFGFCKPVPEDADAREELLVRSLYRCMQEEHFTDAYRMLEVKPIQGDGAGEFMFSSESFLLHLSSDH